MKNITLQLKDFLKSCGIEPGHHVMVHSSFRKIRAAFPGLTIEEMIECLEGLVSGEGSIIMPAFTYCFKRSEGDYEIFDPAKTPSKVGAVSEVFRRMPNVVRTSSPTHSFALWGKVNEFIDSDNAPDSPLGEGSVLDFLAGKSNSHILMLNVHFDALSFGHYLEIKAKTPWIDIFPWDYLRVLPVGVSVKGEQKLREIPGCAKSFVNLEKFLLERGLVKTRRRHSLFAYYFSVSLLMNHGMYYFKHYFRNLLCASGSCPACDSRRKKLNTLQMRGVLYS
ncbi:MAG: AAC(3) family N-acetyltransferase [Calditrichaeota bacterium]|nr:AAC(3) family N-acetyltransferase [Calditrichota bacterium]